MNIMWSKASPDSELDKVRVRKLRAERECIRGSIDGRM